MSLHGGASSPEDGLHGAEGYPGAVLTATASRAAAPEETPPQGRGWWRFRSVTFAEPLG